MMSKVAADLIKPLAVKPTLNAIAESQRAEWRIDYLKRHSDLASEQLIGLSKWLNASLFAANSGGVLTILNQAEKISHPIISGICFIIGLVFSLLSATAIQSYQSRMIEPIWNLIAYWQEVRIIGETDPETLQGLNSELTRLGRWTWLGPTLGWLAGLAFIAGCIAVAIGLGQQV